MNLKSIKNARVLVDCETSDLHIDIGGECIPFNNNLCYVDREVKTVTATLDDFTVHEDGLYECAVPTMQLEVDELVKVDIRAVSGEKVYEMKDVKMRIASTDEGVCVEYSVEDAPNNVGYSILIQDCFYYDTDKGELVNDNNTHIYFGVYDFETEASCTIDALTVEVTRLATKKISAEALELPEHIDRTFVVKWDAYTGSLSASYDEIRRAMDNRLIPVLYREGEFVCQYAGSSPTAAYFTGMIYNDDSEVGKKLKARVCKVLPDGSYEEEYFALG